MHVCLFILLSSAHLFPIAHMEQNAFLSTLRYLASLVRSALVQIALSTIRQDVGQSPNKGFLASMVTPALEDPALLLIHQKFAAMERRALDQIVLLHTGSIAALV